MPHGRSIRIYLADGSASGIRHAEVVNWTGQAIVCPRTRVAELKGWEESQRPGVYFYPCSGQDVDAHGLLKSPLGEQREQDRTGQAERAPGPRARS